MKNNKRSFLFRFSLFIFSISFLSLLFARRSSAFLGFFTERISAPVRNFLLKMSNFAPFSLYELILFLSPALLVFLIYLLRAGGTGARRRFLAVIATLLLVFSLFINNVFICYSVRIPNATRQISASELEAATLYLIDEVNSFGGEARDFSSVAEKLFASYSRLALPETHLTARPPRIKQIKNEKLASYLGVLASYSFLTSEISVNTEPPSYTVIFSIAHEMAHLFGILREADASLYAYIASIETRDGAIAYSASLFALEYLFSELSYRDSALYSKAYASLSEKARSDVSEYRQFYEGYKSLLVASADKANEALLDAADDSGYGEFSRLLVAYLIDNGICN